MDESTLNDLLECSVCLDRLDTTSKVLPCQHTFCRKCLENIVSSHKTLRCPECRILIDVRIDDLPPNVLLMRILGGMKTAAQTTDATKATSRTLIDLSLPTEGQLPFSTTTAATTTTTTVITQPQQVVQAPQHNPASHHNAISHSSHPSVHHSNILQPNAPQQSNQSYAIAAHQQSQLLPVTTSHNNQQHPTVTAAAVVTAAKPAVISAAAAATHPSALSGTVPRARALFDYVSKDQGDISFKKGDLIHLRKRLDAHWFHGELNGVEGVFPVNYVLVLVPLPIAQCRALYDFRMGPAEEDGCLTFCKNAIITVLRRVDQNWAEGRHGECIGIFPIAFVEMNPLAKRMMQEHVAAAAAASTSVSAIAANLPASLSTAAIPPHNLNRTANPASVAFRSSAELLSSDSSSSSTLTNSTVSSPSTTSSSSSSTPTSPVQQQLLQQQQVVLRQPLHNNKAANEHKRHSLTALSFASSAAAAATASLAGSAGASANPNRHSVEILSAPDPAEPSHSSTTFSSTITNNPTDPSSSSSNITNSTHKPQRRSQPAPSSTSSSAHKDTPTSTSTSSRTRIVRSSVHSGGTSSASSHLTLPANYIALYPYKPHKADELELKKGAIYVVTERCQDGWFKGTTRGHKSGVFPGNYVAPMRNASNSTSSSSTTTTTTNPRDRNQLLNLKQQANIIVQGLVGATATAMPHSSSTRDHRQQHAHASHHNHANSSRSSPHHGQQMHGSSTRSSSSNTATHQTLPPPPELPPRSSAAASSNSDSVWTKPLSQQVESFFSRKSNANGTPDRRDSAKVQQPSTPSASGAATNGSGSATISLMKRLTSIKRAKSPPSKSAFSMDNPVFEGVASETANGGGADAAAIVASAAVATAAGHVSSTGNSNKVPQLHLSHPVHVRSGSCPSQLLHNLSLDVNGGSQRLKGRKERPTLQGLHRSEVQSSRHTPTRHSTTANPTGTPQHYTPHSTAARPSNSNGHGHGHHHHQHLPSTASSSYHRKSHSLDATTIASQLAQNAVQTGPNGIKHTKPPAPIPNAPAERFRCIVPYPPNSEFELELHVNDIVLVHKKRDNGWYKGTHTRTGRIGLFPASFVEPDL